MFIDFFPCFRMCDIEAVDLLSPFHLLPCAQDSEVEAGERFDLGRTMLSSADLLSTSRGLLGVLEDSICRSERVAKGRAGYSGRATKREVFKNACSVACLDKMIPDATELNILRYPLSFEGKMLAYKV
jgi:hypothetical protein